MSQETTKIIESGLIEQTKSDYILSKFKSYTDIAKEWSEKANSIKVTDESQTDIMEQAKEGRLILKSKRIEIEKTRKSLKEQSLTEGRLIDSVAKQLMEIIAPAEKYLELQEKYAEIKEQERVSLLKISRTELLNDYREVVDLDNLDLGLMTEVGFDSILRFAKRELQEKRDAELQEKVEKEAKEKADAIEREKDRLENIRLKEQAKKLQEEIDAEKLKAIAVQKEIEVEKVKTIELEKQIQELKVTPEIIAQIDVIDAKVEEVCPTHNIDYEAEYVMAMEQEIIDLNNKIKKLEEKEKLSIGVLDYALSYIMHENLRKTLEKTIKILKE